MEVRSRFQLVDATICSFLFAPFVVLFWHGTFGVLDNVILRQSPYEGAWLIIVIGVAIQVLASCVQDHVHDFVSTQPAERHKAFMLVYNFILGIAQILQFRGLNDLYEQHIGFGVSDAVSATVTSVVILCALRLCSQTVDVPFVLGLDTHKPVAQAFKYTGYHGTSPGLYRDHILDACSTIGVMQTCVHIFAIASWIAVDSGFFKEIQLLAILSSWMGGFGLFISFWMFAHLMQDVSRGMRSDDGRQLLLRFFVDLMLIGEGLGVVMMWHGHWVLYDVMAYWFPISIYGVNYTPYMEVISAFALLSLCHITSSLVRSGIEQDNVDSCIDCIGINATYFAHFFDEDIKKRESEVIAENNNELSSASDDTKKTKAVKRSHDQKSADAQSTRKKQVSIQDLVNLDRDKQKSKKNK